MSHTLLPAEPLAFEKRTPVSQFFQVHPENPQARLIKQAVEIIKGGGVMDAAFAHADDEDGVLAHDWKIGCWFN